MTDMAELSKEDIDGIFQAFKNDDFVKDLRREAKQLLDTAEKSEPFRSVVSMWLMDSMKSVTAGGLEPRKLGAMVLVCFLLGVKHQQSIGGVHPEPKIDMDAVNEMLKQYEKGPDGEKAES